MVKHKYMNACVGALGTVVGSGGDSLKDYIPNNELQIHAKDIGSSIIITFNKKFKVELFKPCIKLGSISTKHRKRRGKNRWRWWRKSSRRRSSNMHQGRKSSRRRSNNVHRGRNSIRQYIRGGANKTMRRRSRDAVQVFGMETMFKLIGFFFFFLYVEFSVRIRSGTRDSNVLTKHEFMFQDVLKYAPNITAIELTGNISAPELLQVLEHSGDFDQVLQPMTLPPSEDKHASFVEAKYPEGSATAQLAIAQTAMPHLKRSLIDQETRHSFYKWDIGWEVVDGDVKVKLEEIQLDKDTRFRTGINSSKALTQLVLSSAHEQIKTMVQTGLIRNHEVSGVASLALANFIPSVGILPESMKIVSGYHRDSIGQHNPKFKDQYKSLKEEKIYDALYGPTMVGKESNSTMVRRTFIDQIMSFTYEKGALESKVRAYVQNRDGKTKIKLIDQTQSGQSNTFMIDQSSGLQHQSRQVPFSMDRRAILFNVMPIQ